MADSTNVEPPPQPPPDTSNDTQAQPDEMAISTPDNHHGTDTTNPSDQTGSIKTENMAEGTSRSHPTEDANDAASLDAPHSRIVKLNANADRLRALLQGLQDVAPTDATAPRESHSNTMTPIPAASTPAAGSRAQTPAAASAPTPPVKAEAVAPTAAASVAMPAEPAAHGAPTRVYLNARVTQHLMEGMKELALKQPEQPLRVLGQFLLQRSLEVEGPAGTVDGYAPTTNGNGAAATAAADDNMRDVEE